MLHCREIMRRKKRAAEDNFNSIHDNRNLRDPSKISNNNKTPSTIVPSSTGSSSRPRRRSGRLQQNSSKISSISKSNVNGPSDQVKVKVCHTDPEEDCCGESSNSLTLGGASREKGELDSCATFTDGTGKPFPTIISFVSTNASGLTQYSADEGQNANAPKEPKRRSKRLSSASRTEVIKKQKSQIFSTDTSQSKICSQLGNMEDGKGERLASSRQTIGTLSSPPLNDSTQRKQIDLDAISSYVASHNLPLLSQQSTPLVRVSTHDSLELTHLFKCTYGSEYFESLLQRECDACMRMESRKREWALLLTSGVTKRPRTRSFCRELEEYPKYLHEPAYISNQFQQHINANMRATLVDWLIGVAKDLNLSHETIHCCVKLLDRGLEEIIVTRDTFHTYGCACLLVATKLNEVKRTRAVDIAFFTDEVCTPREICEMEMKICITLKFSLQLVTAYHFLDRFIDASHFTMGSYSYDNDIGDGPTFQNVPSHARIPPYNPKLEATALFILESALLLPNLVDTKDSLIAAASLYLARAIVGIRDKEGRIWNRAMVHHTGFSIDEMNQTVMLLLLYIEDAKSNPHMASVRTKYKTREYFHVACKVAILPEDLQLHEPGKG